jgi:hypothetical protein
MKASGWVWASILILLGHEIGVAFFFEYHRVHPRMYGVGVAFQDNPLLMHSRIKNLLAQLKKVLRTCVEVRSFSFCVKSISNGNSALPTLRKNPVFVNQLLRDLTPQRKITYKARGWP